MIGMADADLIRGFAEIEGGRIEAGRAGAERGMDRELLDEVR
jgi:hypothetical protein